MRRAAFAWMVLAGSMWAADLPEPLGHWALDEKDGEAVADTGTGKTNGKTSGKPGRTEGKIGGAFSFNGKDSYVEIGNSKDLDKVQEGSYTLSVWFKPENAQIGRAHV